MFADVLDESGYTLCLNDDTAIAYKNEKFELVKEVATQNDEGPAHYADLRLKKGKKVVRFASDHPAFSETGEPALRKNVDQIDIPNSPFKRLLRKIFPLFIKKPVLIVYGLDANATRVVEGPEKDTKEWQPERLEVFTERGFRTNLDDDNPTMNYLTPQKIDHIFVKSISGSVDAMECNIIAGLNDEKILTEPEEFPASDHLPLIYRLEVQTSESWKSLIGQCF